MLIPEGYRPTPTSVINCDVYGPSDRGTVHANIEDVGDEWKTPAQGGKPIRAFCLTQSVVMVERAMSHFSGDAKCLHDCPHRVPQTL